MELIKTWKKGIDETPESGVIYENATLLAGR
jgi:hypothetical protein